MIITDLNHIEVVSTKESSITGAGALAYADAYADAIGKKFAKSATYTDATAIYFKGYAAASSSSSSFALAY